jgi:hypothetical protein
MANLKLGSGAALDKNGFIQNYPVGSIIIRANSTIDDGWLLCDGRPVNNADYPELVNHLSYKAKLSASDAASNDYFGKSIAVSLDGNTALISSPSESTSPNSQNGAVYVFVFSGGVWTEQQKLLASDATSGDSFGSSLALSSDGNTAIIGAYSEGASFQGAAYVFTRSGGVWTQQQKLVASDRLSLDAFGISVALSSDGNTALIGAYQEDTSPTSSNGAVYYFTRSGSVWTQQQKLLASDRSGSEFFGLSVALSSDATVALIGAYVEDTSPNTNNGAVYYFTRSGSVWTEQQKLLASDAASNDYFGTTVALSSDGNTALIGAYQESTSPNTNNGAVYCFTRSGGVWTQEAKILASDKINYHYFGASLSISSDGNMAIIGAENEGSSIGNSTGAAYLFTRSGGVWTQQRKFFAPDVQSEDTFGYWNQISPDGARVMISSPFVDTSPNSNNGAVYVFDLGSSLPYGGSSSTFNLPPLVYNATNNPTERIPFSTISSEASYPASFTHGHTVGINSTSFSVYNHYHNHNSNTSGTNADTHSHNHGSVSGNTNTSGAGSGSSGTRAAGPAGPYASGPSGGTNHTHGGAAWSAGSNNYAYAHTHNITIHNATNHNHNHNTNIGSSSHSVNTSNMTPLSKHVYFLIKT